MKRLAVTLLKFALSLGILAWLFWRASGDQAFASLKERFFDPGFNWALLGLALASMFVAVLLTFWRWYVLVRALDIPFSTRDSLRLGFLGYLFNLAPMGIVGGDLLKAVLLARQQPTRRAHAVATVAVDRVIGLYILFVVASAAIFASGFWQHPDANVRFISLGTLALTAVSTAGMGTLFVPGVTNGRLTDWLSRRPGVGHQIDHVIEAVRLYRSNWGVLAITSLMSVGVHVLFTTGFFLITLGIYRENAASVTFPEELVVAPLASATGVIPLFMGPLELVLEYLYIHVFNLAVGQGLVVALTYRLISLLIALVGACYYFASRREVQEVMHSDEGPEAEFEADASSPATCSTAEGHHATA